MRVSAIDRLFAKVVTTGSGCWEFIGARNRDGYGHIKVDGRTVDTHRLAFEHFRGSIPAGLVLDHLCRNPPCCNPDHLEVVTVGVNIERGRKGRAMRWVEKTSCRRGHPYTDGNTYMDPRGHRQCRACNRDSVRRYRERVERNP